MNIGIVGMLGIVFVCLKLTHNINWSWWWVTLPFWGGIALYFFGFFIWLIYEARKTPEQRRQDRLDRWMKRNA